MLFNSLHYLLFFPIVAVLYYIIPGRQRHFLLLVASYYFYMSWKPEYLVLILTTTLVTFFSAKFIEANREKKKLYLIICLVIDFGILFIFKYFNFFNEIISSVAGNDSPGGFFELRVLLPVGISFYTFQTVSYIIDVYRKKIECEKDVVFFALYVSFFPQLVAGPIERAGHLLPQFKKDHEFDTDRVKDGIGMILFGFFKKIVIADRISVVVDKAFENYTGLSSLNMFIAVLLFGIQIYCDFSGYSDIAVGSARIMGIELMQNFRRPYFASGFSEFWSRWHISLSTWFKDYVYIPLGGNRKGKGRRLLNTFVTFAISGLWHGASFTFIIWGCVHGLLVVLERALKQVNKRSIIRIIFVYIFVNLAWILFRSETLGQAWDIFVHILGFDMTFDIKSLGLSTYQLTVMISSVSMLFLHSLVKELRLKISIPDEIVFAMLAFIIVFFGYFSSQEFIYFRF